MVIDVFKQLLVMDFFHHHSILIEYINFTILDLKPYLHVNLPACPEVATPILFLDYKFSSSVVD